MDHVINLKWENHLKLADIVALSESEMWTGGWVFCEPMMYGICKMVVDVLCGFN